MILEFGMFDHMEMQHDIGLDQLYRERLDLLALADRLGIWGYHLAEHHQAPLSVAPSQNVFLAAAAARTERLHLCPLVYCLPLYHPLRLIEEVAMLDNLSGGRLQFGVGRGISALEHQFFGHSPEEAAARFTEEFDILLAGLSNDRLTFRGEYFQFEDVPMVLRPKQAPYPPLWYAGNVEYAAKRGMNFIGGGPLRNLPAQAARYRELWAEFAESPERLNPHVPDPKLGAVKFLFVADTDAEAERIARRAFTVRAANWPKPGYEAVEPTTGGRGIHPSFNGDYDLATKVEVLLAGSPETILAYVQEFAAKSDMNYFVGGFQWGDLSHEEAAHSLQLFGTKVMPLVQ